MSSYLSNLLTQTTSRYNSLRRTLLSSEDDGDTDDDTHVCRVLRAYYAEKGRAAPAWLPPDPNDRRAITPQPYGNAGQPAGGGYFTSAGGRSQYGGGGGPAAAGGGGGGGGGGARGGGGLSDLWDSPRASGSTQGPPQSLRSARRAPVGGGAGAGAGGGGGGGGSAPMAGNPGLAPPSGPRPLPSQRSGSYQSVASQQGGGGGGGGSMDTGGAASGGGGGGGGSAQDRLKARLWGGARATSPAPGQTGGGVPPNQYDASGGQGGRRYGR